MLYINLKLKTLAVIHCVVFCTFLLASANAFAQIIHINNIVHHNICEKADPSKELAIAANSIEEIAYKTSSKHKKAAKSAGNNKYYAKYPPDEASCFDPKTDKYIQNFLQPNKLNKGENADGTPQFQEVDMHEDQHTMNLIHQKIYEAYSKYNMDPRLIYYRMIGESSTNPFPDAKSGYGIFQFIGKNSCNGGKSHRDVIKNEIKKNPNKSPRLIQVEYYVDNYIACVAKYSNGKDFSDLTPLEQVTHLGLGNHGAGNLRTEQKRCGSNPNLNYVRGACQVLGTLIKNSYSPENLIPVCGRI